MNTNTINDTAVVILAAGKGTRMKSDKAKVLHELNGKPMIKYVVDAAIEIAGRNVVVVVGHQADVVRQTVLADTTTCFALQEEQLGTGHAVICALPEIKDSVKSVVVLCGDVPLIKSETILNLRSKHLDEDCKVTVLAVKVENPFGYGRMVVDNNGQVQRIVEEADATQQEKTINVINSGIYCIDRQFLADALGKINNNNAQGELYLTDIIGIAYEENKKVGMYIGNSDTEVKGVNTLDDLSKLQTLINS